MGGDARVVDHPGTSAGADPVSPRVRSIDAHVGVACAAQQNGFARWRDAANSLRPRRRNPRPSPVKPWYRSRMRADPAQVAPALSMTPVDRIG
jgi:hypothetical protein